MIYLLEKVLRHDINALCLLSGVQLRFLNLALKELMDWK